MSVQRNRRWQIGGSCLLVAGWVCVYPGHAQSPESPGGALAEPVVNRSRVVKRTPLTSQKRVSIPLIRQVRFSTGLPFSAVRPKQDSTTRLLEAVKQEGGKSFERYLKAAEQEIEKLKHPDPLPPCGAAREDKLDFRLTEKIPDEVIVEDLLFLAEDPPLDAESRFGESAMVQVLSGKASPALRGFADAMGVTCLPYRVRTTTQSIYRFEGEAALKRYEEILNKEGEK